MSTSSSAPIVAPQNTSAAHPAGPHPAGPAPAGNPAAEIEAWIREINGDLGCSVGWGVSAGARLIDAKQQLGHGRWLTLFGPGKLAFGIRKGQMLMEIARNPSLKKTQNFARLPAAWSTLHALSKLRPESLDAMIANGTVHPQLKLEAARRLAMPYSPAAAAGRAEGRGGSFDAAVRRERLLVSLRREAENWPPQFRLQLAGLLQQFASDLLNVPPPKLEAVPEPVPNNSSVTAPGLDKSDFTKRTHEPPSNVLPVVPSPI